MGAAPERGTSMSLLQQEWVGPHPKATEDR